MFLIVLISLRLTELISHDAGIDKGFFVITERTVIIGKIHQQRLRQLSLIGSIHRLHIIFIKSGQAESSVHCQGKPTEILRLSWIPQHNITTDRLQRIIGRKSIVSHCHRLIHTLVKFLFVTGQIGKAHHQFFGKHLFSSCQQKDLCPETAHSVKKSHISADILPRFQIKEGASASSLKLLFHHKYDPGCGANALRRHLKQNPEQQEAVLFLHIKALQSSHCLIFILI